MPGRGAETRQKPPPAAAGRESTRPAADVPHRDSIRREPWYLQTGAVLPTDVAGRRPATHAPSGATVRLVPPARPPSRAGRLADLRALHPATRTGGRPMTRPAHNLILGTAQTAASYAANLGISRATLYYPPKHRN